MDNKPEAVVETEAQKLERANRCMKRVQDALMEEDCHFVFSLTQDSEGGKKWEIIVRTN
jgi:hypothetical protein